MRYRKRMASGVCRWPEQPLRVTCCGRYTAAALLVAYSAGRRSNSISQSVAPAFGAARKTALRRKVRQNELERP